MEPVNATGCPQRMILQQFLRAELQEQQAKCIDSHVASCEVCLEMYGP